MVGTVSVLAFDDRNGDGMRDEGEELLAGSMIRLLTIDRQLVAEYATDGVNEPHTFTVEPGKYLLIEGDAEGFISTSPNDWGIVVAAGESVDIAFGDQRAPAPTATTVPPTPTATPQPTPSVSRTRTLVYSISGILVALFALLLPLIFRWVRSRV